MINLYNQDCLDAMRRMDTDQYDLAIVDPPYGIGAGIEFDIANWSSEDWKQARAKNYKKKQWDNKTPSKEYFTQLLRVSKHYIIWGCNYFTRKLCATYLTYLHK